MVGPQNLWAIRISNCVKSAPHACLMAKIQAQKALPAAAICFGVPRPSSLRMIRHRLNAMIPQR